MSDWYRNKIWDESIESDFLNRLQNTMPEEIQVTALKVQGDLWLKSRDETTQQAGITLLQKLIHNYPQEIYEVATVQDILGDYYYQRADFDNAEPYLYAALGFYKANKRIGVIRKADLMLAEIILLRNASSRLEEAWKLATGFPDSGGSLSEDHEQYNYYELLARIAYRTDRKPDAIEYAARAIALAQTIELDFMIAKSADLEKLYLQQPSLEIIAGQ